MHEEGDARGGRVVPGHPDEEEPDDQDAAGDKLRRAHAVGAAEMQLLCAEVVRLEEGDGAGFFHAPALRAERNRIDDSNYPRV